MNKDEIKNGIAGYKKRQQAIMDAIAKAGGELSQDAFDVEFRRSGKDFFGPLGGEGARGDSFILGGLNQGYYGEMLHLCQLMAACDILEIRGEAPNLRYARKSRQLSARRP